jgi:hypothetical protein
MMYITQINSAVATARQCYKLIEFSFSRPTKVAYSRGILGNDDEVWSWLASVMAQNTPTNFFAGIRHHGT